MRFLACLSSLHLLALNTFGKREKEGEDCTLDAEDQGWWTVYACSRCCHTQWTSFLCVGGAIVFQVQDGFGLLEIAVTGVLSYQIATQLSCQGWVDPVPDPILPEKFLGYSRESNPGAFGWQSYMVTTIPNRQSHKIH